MATTKKTDRPTMPSYTTDNSYEVWYFSEREWHMRGTRKYRDDAVQLAESMGHPYWAVVRCRRDVEINSVED